MMIKKITVFLAFLLCFGTVSAQSVEQFFLNLPDEYFALFSKEQRGLLIDNYRSEKKGFVRNAFEGRSAITDMDSLYLRVQVTPVSTLELKVWTKNGEAGLVGMNETVCNESVCASRLHFFDKEMIPIDKNALLPPITVADFLDEEKIISDGKTFEEIELIYGILFIHYIFDKESDEIMAESQTRKYLSEDLYKEIELYVKADRLVLTLTD